jgi:hypothetical protein
MYIMARKTRWSVAAARQHLPRVIASAAREPQAIYRRAELVAAVVSPAVAARAAPPTPGPSLEHALAELRAICAEEEYDLPVPRRRNRRTRPRR